MTLLSIAQDIADEIGIIRPAALVGSSDDTSRRMLACAKAAGQELYRSANWSVLHREYEFETEAGEENYAVPGDFGRMISETAWDRAQYRQMRGGLTPAQWQRLRSSQVATTGLTRRFRLIAGAQSGSILLDPVPTSDGDDLVYEYISAFWCEDAAGNGKATFTVDSDEFRLDLEVFRLGWLWRMQKALGNSYADDRNSYELALREALKSDVILPIVSMARSAVRPYANLPEGGFTL